MKRIFTLIASIIIGLIPCLLFAEIYVLKIITKDGRTIEIETQNIEKMEISKQVPIVTALSMPDVKISTNASGEMVAQWDSVANANHYAYSINGGQETSTTATMLSFGGFAPGLYRLTVAAVPTGANFLRSADCVVEFEVTFKVNIKQTMIGLKQASFTLTPSHRDIHYLAAVIPATVSTDNERIAQVRMLASSDATLRHIGDATVSFDNLEQGANYQIVVFQEENPKIVYADRFTTNTEAYKPGTTGYIFPPGVDLNGGYVDVDKVGKLDKYGYTGTDEELCWACSTAGMIQWWLDDYKRATGNSYPLCIALPQQSKCYSTPIMDVLAQAFYQDAGNPNYVLQWFFSGMPNAIGSYNINGHAAFNTSYAYVQGNFACMSRTEYAKYVSKELYSYFLYKDLSESEVKVRASADIISWLKDGPLYIAINGGNHALTCWGVKYTVDINSKPIITHIYFAENDLLAGNIKGGLNSSSITWRGGDGPHMTSTNGVNVEISNFIPIKGYSRVK